MMARIKRALLSVSDKTGVVEFARALAQMDVELLSTGGTAKLLADAGISVTEVADYTGFAEMLDGRVKTLHPKIHAGILAQRDQQAHREQLQQANIDYIDLVCVNLYPFAATIAKAGCTLTEAIENIDIGGPAMLRSAAKNWRDVAVVTHHEDYEAIIQQLQAHNQVLSEASRFDLARKAFAHTAAYDHMIADYLAGVDVEHSAVTDRAVFPQQLNRCWQKIQDLRYGENPHQQAAFYRDINPQAGSLACCTQLQGKELSYNNIGDADAAWRTVKSFQQPACVIIKHANPCGVAVAENVLNAYHLALATDKSSAFGGVIAFNGEVDGATAQAVTASFVEVLIAPCFTAEALMVLQQKKNIRVLAIPLVSNSSEVELKQVSGGLLVQTADIGQIDSSQFQVVTRCQPTMQQWQDLQFVWNVAKYVKSNAIVFGAQGQTYGIGAGQMSRVDSSRIAAYKAEMNGFNLPSACAASDAFFPFRDGVDVIAEHGIKAIIQPGGSIRDDEVIAAADEHHIAMVLTGMRHFRH